MRNSLVGWFVLGLFLPAGGIGVGVLLYCCVTGAAVPPADQVRLVLAGAAVYVLIRIFAGRLAPGSRGLKRHDLFTPLYNQRPHEWTSRIA